MSISLSCFRKPSINSARCFSRTRTRFSAAAARLRSASVPLCKCHNRQIKHLTDHNSVLTAEGAHKAVVVENDSSVTSTAHIPPLTSRLLCTYTQYYRTYTEIGLGLLQLLSEPSDGLGGPLQLCVFRLGGSLNTVVEGALCHNSCGHSRHKNTMQACW
jgi:hypothetical protein